MRAHNLENVIRLVTPEGWVNFYTMLEELIDTIGFDRCLRIYRKQVDEYVELEEQKALSRESHKKLGLRPNPWDPDKFYYQFRPEDRGSLPKKGPFRPSKRPYFTHVGFFPDSPLPGDEDDDNKRWLPGTKQGPPPLQAVPGGTFNRTHQVIWPLGEAGPRGEFLFGPIKSVGGMRMVSTSVVHHYKIETEISDVKAWKMVAVPAIMQALFNTLNFGIGPHKGAARGVSEAMNDIGISFTPLDPYMKIKQISIKGRPTPVETDAWGYYVKAGGFEWIRLATTIASNVINEFVTVTREKIMDNIGPEGDWMGGKKGIGSSPEYAGVLGQIGVSIITLLHELGHRVDLRCLDDESSEKFAAWMEHKDLNPAVSLYSTGNAREWFAEHWVAWLVDGLAYNNDVKKAFEKILQLEPTVNVEDFAIYTNFTNEGVDLLANGFKSFKTGDYFTMTVTYENGTSRTLEGNFIEVSKNRPLPTLKYKDDGKIRHFTIFPNRRALQVEVI